MPKRVDANHALIAQALRQCGWCVKSTASLRGFVDLVAAKHGVVKLIEVKDGSKPLSKQALTPLEVEFHREMLAVGCPVTILRSVEEAVQL